MNIMGKLTINHADRLIVMDRTFAKYAANTLNVEYTHLQQVRNDYPEYTIIQRHIKTKKDKNSYHGLTYTYMESYIMTHGTEETRLANFKEYTEKRLISECHSKGFRYPLIKKWFLEKYPEIMAYAQIHNGRLEGNVETDETSIDSKDAA